MIIVQFVERHMLHGAEELKIIEFVMTIQMPWHRT